MSSPHSKKVNSKKRSANAAPPDFFTLSKKALIGGGVAVLSTILLSLIAAALCLLSPDPAALTLPVGLSVFFISAAVGGAVCSTGFKGKPRSAAVAAVLCGFLFVIITGICAAWQSAAAPQASHSINTALAIALRFLAIPTSAASAILVSKQKKAKRRRRK